MGSCGCQGRRPHERQQQAEQHLKQTPVHGESVTKSGCRLKEKCASGTSAPQKAGQKSTSPVPAIRQPAVHVILVCKHHPVEIRLIKRGCPPGHTCLEWPLRRRNRARISRLNCCGAMPASAIPARSRLPPPPDSAPFDLASAQNCPFFTSIRPPDDVIRSLIYVFPPVKRRKARLALRPFTGETT